MNPPTRPDENRDEKRSSADNQPAEAEVSYDSMNEPSGLGRRWMLSGLGALTTIVDVVDLRRFRGPAGAIACVGLGMVLVSSAIAAIEPRWPKWLYPNDPTARIEDIEKSGKKLAALVRGTQRLGNDRLGILLGSSSMMLGVSGRSLEAESRDGVRWLDLCSGGINGDDVARVFRLILWSGLKPEYIILGLQPDMLAQTTDCLGPDGDEIYLYARDLSRDLSLKRFSDSVADIEKLWSAYLDQIFPSRTLVNYRLRDVIFEIKCNAFRTARMTIDSMFLPQPGAWREVDSKERLGPLTIRQGHFKNGRFNSQSYQVDNINFRALDWVIEEARRRGIQLLLVSMPASRFDRVMQPPPAEKTFRALLEREPAKNLPLLNLRSEFADESFADLFHLAKDARETASKRVAELLRDHNENRPRSKLRPEVR